jgi:hypothetical protein
MGVHPLTGSDRASSATPHSAKRCRMGHRPPHGHRGMRYRPIAGMDRSSPNRFDSGPRIRADCPTAILRDRPAWTGFAEHIPSARGFFGKQGAFRARRDKTRRRGVAVTTARRRNAGPACAGRAMRRKTHVRSVSIHPAEIRLRPARAARRQHAGYLDERHIA